MNRLQVGGLALVINAYCESNIGRVVLLEKYMGDMTFVKDAWLVSSSELIENLLTKPQMGGHISSKNLMPLGDKQKQDELAKEKENELTLGV